MAKLTLNDLANLQNENTAVSTINANNAALEVALENTLSRDGTTPNQMNAPLDMNSQRIINLPSPITATEPLRFQDLVDFNGGGTISTLPSGGAAGAFLQKVTANNYDVAWNTNPIFRGSTSGTITLQATAVAGSNTLTLPAATDTLIGKATTDTLTNKTFDTAGTGNSFAIAGFGVTATTGTGSTVVRATSPTITTPTLVTPVIGVASGTSLSLAGGLSSADHTVTSTSASGLVVGPGGVTNPTLQVNCANSNATGISIRGGLAGTGVDVNVISSGTNENLRIDAKGTGTVTIGNSSTGNIILNRDTQYTNFVGTTAAGNAATGALGEVISSTISQPSHVSLTTLTGANVTSISLSAGDWDVYATCCFDGGTTTQVPFLLGSISTTSATKNSTPGNYSIWQAAFATATPFNFGASLAEEIAFTIGPVRVNVSSPTTVYLVAYAQFSVSTAFAFGTIRARRIR